MQIRLDDEFLLPPPAYNGDNRNRSVIRFAPVESNVCLLERASEARPNGAINIPNLASRSNLFPIFKLLILFLDLHKLAPFLLETSSTRARVETWGGGGGEEGEGRGWSLSNEISGEICDLTSRWLASVLRRSNLAPDVLDPGSGKVEAESRWCACNVSCEDRFAGSKQG